MSVFDTFTFWLCVVGTVVNAGLLIVSKYLHSHELGLLALNCLLLCAFGGVTHWYLDRKHSKRK